MKAKDLKKKYYEFFQKKDHKLISSASLIPEHDPTVLFTTAGMHPLVPHFTGIPHLAGKRLVNVQKCIRTGDIDCVGDPHHLTFFEMLGNWSLGDYFKEDAIKWSYEFLIDVLKFDPEKISITCFIGDKDAPKDTESAKVWTELGIPKQRIYFLPKSDNWWGPAGTTGPCGPCTEMFIDTGKEHCGKACKPGCNCGKYFEIWNDVFIEYEKKEDGAFKSLRQKSVDTGMGVERTAAMLQGKDNVYEIESFVPIIDKIKELAKINKPNDQQTKSIRIIADHIRAAVFILGDEHSVVPSNLDQGYVLRRFIRRAVRHSGLLSAGLAYSDMPTDTAKVVISIYKNDYPEIKKKEKFILDELKKETEKFQNTIEKGLKEIRKHMELIHPEIIKSNNRNIGKSESISPKWVFDLFQSHGMPLEMTIEEIEDAYDIKIENKKEIQKEFAKKFKKHQELSRIGAEQRFKGGLSDAGEETAKLHTATHLLNQALRKVLGTDKIHQKGSNITPQRLRFDFNFDRKLTKEEIEKVEAWVNKRIKESHDITFDEVTLHEAKERGAFGVFSHKYGSKVFVYSIGDKSIEICGGPHVKNTGELGHFKIKKEESSSSGVRRIKAVLE